MIFFREMRDQRRVRAVLVEEAFATRNGATVVAVVKNDRIFGEAVFSELIENFSERFIGAGDAIVVLGDIGANAWRIRQIGRHADLGRIGHEG